MSQTFCTLAEPRRGPRHFVFPGSDEPIVGRPGIEGSEVVR